jgi:hypothetical protein
MCLTVVVERFVFTITNFTLPTGACQAASKWYNSIDMQIISQIQNHLQQIILLSLNGLCFTMVEA